MGLDMYLKAKKFNPGGYDHMRKADREDARATVREFDKIVSALHMTRQRRKMSMESLEVSLNVGYWRKQNAIHSWFVRETQDGKDECQESYVSREDLVRLRDICRQILATVVFGDPIVHEGNEFYPSWEEKTIAKIDADLARDLLEPQSGFFFGGTDLDEWYVSGLEYTADLIDTLLDSGTFEGWDFYYRASW